MRQIETTTVKAIRPFLAAGCLIAAGQCVELLERDAARLIDAGRAARVTATKKPAKAKAA